MHSLLRLRVRQDQIHIGVDCRDLFDTSTPAISFKDHPRDHIPSFGSIIYTVWDKNDRWIYVGIGGVGQSPNTPLKKRNPRSRILQHRSGLRSGDQFCIYVHDYFIVPNLDLDTYEFKRGDLDRMTRAYIQKELSYRFMVFQTEDGARLVRNLEAILKNGLQGIGSPLLNGD